MTWARRSQAVDQPRRTCLVVPGSSYKMLEKAHGLSADQVVLDLEDAVSESAKKRAREQVLAALEGGGWGSPVISVRVNSVTTAMGEDDLVALSSTTGRLDTLIVPKVHSVVEIQIAARALAGRREPVGIEALIESAAGLMNVHGIAQADGITGLVFGPLDMGASLGIPRLAEGSEIHIGDPMDFARFMILVAARATGSIAIDGPFVDIGDKAALRLAAERSRAMGFDGKWVIHPSQIDIVNSVFTPTPEELANAQAVVEALATAAANDRGAAVLNGVMVDEASRRAAQHILARGRRSSAADE